MSSRAVQEREVRQQGARNNARRTRARDPVRSKQRHLTPSPRPRKQTQLSPQKNKREQRAAKAVAALDPTKTATLLLVRHGETRWNAEGRLQGQMLPGPSLSPAGAAQARHMAAALAAEHEISAIYSSDLARAVETADAIAAALVPAAPVRQLPSLRERHLGALLEGVRRADAPAAAPEAFAALRRGLRAPSEALPGGGETLDALAARVGGALLGIARRHPGERCVVVSHGGAIHGARRYAEGAGEGGSGGGGGGGASFSALANGALCEFRIDPEAAAAGRGGGGGRAPGGQWRGGWAVVRWGDGRLLAGLAGAAAASGTAGGGADAG